MSWARNLRWSFSRILVILSVALIYLSFQNCSGGNTVKFFEVQSSLTSQAMDGGNGYDGKPSPGSYCRVFDELKCQAQVAGLQSLLTVNATGIRLEQDNCATTSTNFLFDDVTVKFTSLLPNYIGVSRGIFKKCDLDNNKQPVLPSEMPEAFCNSENQQFSAVINKNLRNSELDLSVAYNSSSGIRTVSANSIRKFIDANNDINYSSKSNEFDLSIKKSTSQTASGTMRIVVDQETKVVNLSCHTSGPQPTVVIEKDMELSSTWLDTSQLVGYWKLNEPNSVEGTTIVDSSLFATSGTLFTGSDGLNKSDISVKGGAISLDGTGDSVRILRPTDGHLDFGTRSFSYMVWIKKSGSRGAFDMPLYHGGGHISNPGYSIECGYLCRVVISDGTNVIGRSAVGAQFVRNGTAPIGQWTLLVAVVDRSSQQLRAYTDGNLVTTVNISLFGSVNSNSEIRLGGIEDGRYPFWGSVDDVAIWNRALADSEILEIFQRLRPKFY